MTNVLYRVNPPITNDVLNNLFRASWSFHHDTNFQVVLTHSLLYLCAYHNEAIIGFVNVAWDGGIHAFLLDTTVHPAYRRQGIGLQLVRQAAALAQAKGIHWLHVDYEPHLHHFYQECGFEHTEAALLRLNQ
ncbi:MAG: GNAT family N-acetyltransferase [Anaerolineae bacterium]|nr:GNAT family N-acetyltransferase [Anaerolineae bacterium]